MAERHELDSGLNARTAGKCAVNRRGRRDMTEIVCEWLGR